MDKEILRIVIIATGALVMVCMVLWSMLKGDRRHSKQKSPYKDKNSFRNIDPSLVLHPEHDNFDVVPLGSPLDYDRRQDDELSGYGDNFDLADNDRQVLSKHYEHALSRSHNKSRMPALIQLNLAAEQEEGFNGQDLANVFADLGLAYGSIKIYEKLDPNGLVDFAVANMVEPGIFPNTDLKNFFCPGLVFFMQPRELENPLAVFDELIRTINYLAVHLNGIKWDKDRELLTEEKVVALRASLA